LVFWVGSALVLLVIFLPGYKKKHGLAFDLGYWQPKVALNDKGRWLFTVLIALISILMVMILANPLVTIRQTVAIYGKPVMVVVDVSGSMEYKGRAGKEGLSAREKARIVFDDLLSRGVEADLGLLIYSTENYIARTFAYKDTLFRDTLENDEEIIFLATGTRTAEALAKARTFLLKNEDTQEKAIILVSDLEADLEGIMELTEEVDRNALAGIKIYTIITEGEEQWARSASSKQTAADGMLIIGMNDKTGIDQLCAEINAMESSPIRTEESLVKKSLVSNLIVPTLGLIVLCLAFSETTFRKIS
jgi:hypothetical protein